MTQIPLQTFLVPLALIALLLCVLVFVRARGVKMPRGAGKRMQLREVMPLGGRERVAILDIDGRDFIVILGGGAPALRPLEARE